MLVLQAVPDFLVHLGDGCPAVLALEGLFDPLVGDVGLLRLLDVVDGDGEHGVFAVELIDAVILGERDVDVESFAGLVAHELVEEVVDVLSDANGDHSALALGRAALKLRAVDASHIVDVDGVAIGHGAVGHLFESRISRGNRGNHRLNLFVGGRHLRGGDGNRLVITGQLHVVKRLDARPVAVLVDACAEVKRRGFLRVGRCARVGLGDLRCRGLGLLTGVVGRGGVGAAAGNHGRHESAGEEQRDESCVAARKGEKSVLVHGSPFLAVST